MPNPLLALIQKHAGPDFVPRAKWLALGLAHDFWKDGAHNPFKFDFKRKPKQNDPIIRPAAAKRKTTQERLQEAQAGSLWHAEPGEISEKMWGADSVTPCDDVVMEALTKPLGLNKDMSVLDLSAGLGGRLRATSEKYGVYITGLEPDPQIAARGMEMSRRAGKAKRDSIEAYDPNNFAHPKHYDVILARETFYRVADKNKFFATLAACSKPHAQIAYTDYVVDPENRDKPAIVKWTAFEKGAAPLSLIETAEAWAKSGYTIRVHDDMTGVYRKEVMKGLARLVAFLGSGVKPDAETKKSLLKRVETWTHRVAAMDQGMKFYRFYGVKND